jgi:hypothetical protein
VLGRHAYRAAATWLVSAQDRSLAPNAQSPDWQISYFYDRWRPALFVSASASTFFAAGPAGPDGAPTPAVLRQRQLETGVIVPIRHTRIQHVAVASILRGADDYTFVDQRLSLRSTAARAGWSTNTAHVYGYSISPEDGFTAGATVEIVRGDSESAGTAGVGRTLTADARAYLPGVARHHVVALRGGIGSSSEDVLGQRSFHLGGSGPNGSVIDFSQQALSLLRGFPADAFAGTHVALINAEYRFPLARPQRGIGTWPLFVHTLHAAVFGDAGHAWSRRFDIAEVKRSAGAELSLDLVAGYSFPLTVAVGAAAGRDGASRAASRSAYVRLSHAF